MDEDKGYPFHLGWTLGKKVGTLAALLLSLLTLIGVFFFAELRGVYQEIKKITSADIPLRKTAHDILTLQFEQHLLIRKALDVTASGSRKPNDAGEEIILDFEDYTRRVAQAIEYGKEAVSVIAARDQAYDIFGQSLDLIRQRYHVFEERGRQAIRLAGTGHLSDAEQHYQSAVKGAEEVNGRIEQLLFRVERLTEKAEKSARKRQVVAVEIGLALGSLTIFVGVFFSFIIVRKWVKSVADLSERAKNIASTVLHDIPSRRKLIIRSSDEIGNLCHAFNQMTEALIHSMEERKQAQDELTKAHDELEKRIEERTRELTLANEQLKELDELKSNFVSLSWHELKSPLVSIQGYVSFILRGKSGPINERQKRFLEHVQNKTEQLKQLIHRLLNLSKIEMQYSDMKLESTDLRQILEQEIMNFKARAQVKEITMEFALEQGLKQICCDQEMVRGMIDNLLSNALKFTPRKGRVQVSARNVEQGVHIDIEDTGVGMKEEALGKIFEPFQRLRQAGTEDEEGTGLGLSLVKKIVEAHKGMIQVSSKEGEGSRFTIFLPENSRASGFNENRFAYAMQTGA